MSVSLASLLACTVLTYAYEHSQLTYLLTYLPMYPTWIYGAPTPTP